MIGAALPADLTDAVRLLAADCGVAPRAVVLAAHAKVMSAVASEPTVVTARRTPDGVRHCAVTVADGSWRDLVARAAAASTRGEEPPATSADAILDVSGVDAPPPAGDATLRLGLRPGARDDGFPERLMGYHLTALRLMVAAPDARQDAQTLLSETEVSTQLHGLAGPRRPLGDRLFVERFEEQVRRRPAGLAAAHGDRRWTYGELNARANQIAHGLLRDGLEPEDVVAVATGRDLDWVAATLGVLKAGGTYLPVRPDFPPDRIATQLERSRCRFALTDAAGERALRAAADRSPWGGRRRPVEQAYALTGASGDPRTPVGAGSLAYIYFTSGSTGAPKGAMCEHTGLLNHLLMKVEDMGLGPGDVVTQTASQCFDISLWQLAAPLLVGGSTLVVDTEAQLDVDGFLDLIAAGGVHVVQVVPSYLDVALARLERRPRRLGDLRAVSVTGEALKLGLVRRWFELQPDVALVNAYGATEVSDDTMHDVLRRAPERELVTVGRPLRNVDAYVLDEDLRLVPLGAPGEIAFGGVCVGRGYVNDPERTAQAFTEDPYRPGSRLYRTGDFGRWLGDGTLEFLGRRDEQVKVRGFRIEIGEIENTLLRMPGVRECAARVDGSADDARKLVAFFTGHEGLQPADLRDFLAASLPDYMIPSSFHRLDALPLNENGKVDKRALSELAGRLRHSSPAYVPPATDTERRLATAWAETLDVLVGRIGRDDDFFVLGGTSLAAVRLVVRLDRAVSLRELVANPVLRDLAAVADARAAQTGGDLLQRLSTFAGEPVASLVCLPYASGNAVNFQLVARGLERARVAVHGVELPGHDVARPDEPMAGVEEIARRVHAEIRATIPEPVALWGHCAGAVHALEVARLLEADGGGAARVFLAAMLLDDPAALEVEIDALAAATNAEITEQLHRNSAYVELDLLKSERAELVGRAYRHDVCSSNRRLIDLQRDPGAAPLGTPVDIVVASDDPATAGHGERFRAWERLAAEVELLELEGGGHYFSRTRADEVAALVLARCGAVEASTRAGAW